VILNAQTVSVRRPAGDLDPYERADLEDRFSLVGTFTSPSDSDRRVGGGAQTIDMVLVAAPTPCLRVGDRIHGDECWTVVSVQARTGLGLTHQRAGVRRTEGAANG
jgi:hypothetical protein